MSMNSNMTQNNMTNLVNGLNAMNSMNNGAGNSQAMPQTPDKQRQATSMINNGVTTLSPNQMNGASGNKSYLLTAIPSLGSLGSPVQMVGTPSQQALNMGSPQVVQNMQQQG